MAKKQQLSKKMSLADFDNGYWYATDLRAFAKSLGITQLSKLRKDGLEQAVRTFLKTGKVKQPKTAKLSTEGQRDVERGLKPSLRVRVYINDKETKQFTEDLALKLDPSYKKKSGARYRLNRWMEEMNAAGLSYTYKELCQEYVRLSKTVGPFKQIETGRYINFLSSFHMANKDAKRSDALKAWHQLKKLDIPKTYKAWAAHQNGR